MGHRIGGELRVDWSALSDVTMLRWRYEMRRCGLMVLAAPAVGLSVAVGGAALSANRGGSRDQVGQLLLSGLEALLPLVVALLAVALLSRDDCRELHLSLPASYAGTLARRVAVLAGVAAILATGYTVVVRATGWWTGPSAAEAALVWLAPGLWLTAVGVVIALASRSVVVSSGLVSGVWLAEQIFAHAVASHDWARPFYLFATSRWVEPDGWLTNRVALVASGVLLATVAALLMRRPERLLTDEEA